MISNERTRSSIFRPKLRITWLCPDDYGGGVISVAQACCRQARAAGHDVTLLLALPPRGHAQEYGGFQLATLDAAPPFADIPIRLVNWLGENPQDILLINGCEQADAAIPFVSADTRVVYCVHDTAERYYLSAIRRATEIDLILAVSETVAAQFRHRLRDPAKLAVAHNGTVLPSPAADVLAAARENDLVFLGGEQPLKGAYDALTLWRILAEGGFAGRLHWFGETSDAFRARIAQLPAADRVVVYGRRPRREIFQATAQAKALLMLSRVEPFGMATIEGMGMGSVPVSWDIDTGTKEIISLGEGFFAPLGDFVALAGAVSRALTISVDQRKAMIERVSRDFSEAAMWMRYAALFDIISAKPPALRPLAGRSPPPYRPPLRLFQFAPAGLRRVVRGAVGRSTRLGYLLRDMRGR